MELQITEYALDLTEEVTNLTINEFGMAVGPTGATGPEGLVWKGAWSAGTAYVVDDAVSYNGSAYICIANVITTDPTNATYWSILASKGDTGATGATGATGLGVPTTTAANDFAVGNGATWDKKTLAETKTILGLSTQGVGGEVHKLRGLVSNPQAMYTQRAQIILMRADAALTITRIHIHGSDTTPTTELAGDLKFADDVNIGGFANATVIDICDTTGGVVTITSAFDDATVPAGKYIYFQMDASPHADWKDFYLEIFYTYD